MSSQVDSLIRSTIDKFGSGGDDVDNNNSGDGSNGIDILVNNAGVAFNRKLIDTTEQEWDQTINTNLKGHVSVYEGRHSLYD
jgi:NAD(P)-dependent dehydrogenase (short-subunit alcohol dehydrogenase family)